MAGTRAKTSDNRKAMLSASARRGKALADEKRAHILRYLGDVGVKAAPELIDELGYTKSVVSYHLGKLVEYDCIELVRVEKVNGGEKKFYRPTEIDYISAPDWEGMEESRKRSALLALMAPVVADFDHALDAGTFGDDGRWHAMRNALKSLDLQGLDDLILAHQELFDRSNEIQQEATERMRESGETPLRVSSSSQCFRVKTFGPREKEDSSRPVWV